MVSPSDRATRLLRWLPPLILAWLTAAALLTAVYSIAVIGRPRSYSVPMGRIVFVAGLAAFFWVVYGVPAALLARRVRLAYPGVWPAAAIHALGALAFAVLQSGSVVVVRTALDNYPISTSARREFVGSITQVGLTHVLLYVVIVASVYGLEYYRQYKDRALRAAELETELAQAQLDVLRMQLQPHFLYNTLHTISALADTDTSTARRMITRLSDLLRLSLRKDWRQEVPLAEELEATQKYLDIHRVRFGDRLSIEVDIDEPDVLVPVFVLQPLVENAIRHGISRRSGPGTIVIRSRVENGMVRLEVHDDGPGPGAEAFATSHGIGLHNTRERLARLYGEEARLRLADSPGGGAVSVLDLPARFAGKYGRG